MHDLDRVQMEGGEYEGIAPEAFEYGEYGEAGEAGESGEGAFEYSGETEEMGESDEVGYEAVSPFQEQEEMQLAAELLEVSTEQELDHFLGKLIRRAAKAAGGFINSPLGRSLGGFLKGAIKKALPLAGGAIGGVFGGPIGSALGSRLAPLAGGMLGLELEGLSNEDKEYEAAKQLIRLSGAASSQAATAPSNATPQAIAQNAVVNAAKAFAPGMLARATSQSGVRPGRRPKSGRWVRRGRVIILMGV